MLCFLYSFLLSIVQPVISSILCGRYSLVLRHTIEEVNAACIEAIDPERMELTSRLRDQVMNELGQSLSKYDWFAGFDIADKQPIKYSLQQWINHVKEAQAVVFIAGIFFNLVQLLCKLTLPLFHIISRFDFFFLVNFFLCLTKFIEKFSNIYDTKLVLLHATLNIFPQYICFVLEMLLYFFINLVKLKNFDWGKSQNDL